MVKKAMINQKFWYLDILNGQVFEVKIMSFMNDPDKFYVWVSKGTNAIVNKEYLYEHTYEGRLEALDAALIGCHAIIVKMEHSLRNLRRERNAHIQK